MYFLVSQVADVYSVSLMAASDCIKRNMFGHSAKVSTQLPKGYHVIITSCCAILPNRVKQHRPLTQTGVFDFGTMLLLFLLFTCVIYITNQQLNVCVVVLKWGLSGKC